jgi:hypothetical protein
MTVKEYANKMGMTVNQICEVTGMSRMGLNNILVKRYRAENPQKRYVAVKKLLKAIQDDADKKMEQVEQECAERTKLLDMFYNE